ncbi:DUF4403 family protein [Geomonas sp. RF6]|uniref:DUF4403 family protein n=1 Tax=Geomonas sp. RF6 TaxID=2897342 RepID=UPI001E5800AB|nr:DUF4403 family protein [Geomonas sp. RF6]UFS71183.1 DUF4403 family protein [Geomonas sp. RF6]
MSSATKVVSLSAAMAAILLITSCATVDQRSGLTAQQPKEEAFRSRLTRQASTVNLAIGASAAELADMLNRLTPKELYRGSAKTKGLTADILRNGTMSVSAADNFLYLSIPISLKLSYGSIETLPYATTLKFKVHPKVTSDWRVDADIYYTGVTNPLPEEVGVGLFSIKPRSILDGLTLPVQQSLSTLICKKLNEKFPLKTEVGKVWSAAQKPILLDKTYSAWLVMTPQEVLLDPLYAQNNQLKLGVGLKSVAEVVVGPQPSERAPVPLPNLKLVKGMDRTFRVALNTELFYRDIVKIASPLLLNKELGENGRSVILKDLEVYGNGERLVVKVVMSGTIDGTFYLTGKPVFNSQTNLFSVHDVDFDLQSRSLLVTSAEWLLHGTIRSKIEEKLNVDLTQNIAQAREMAGKAMQRVNLAQNVFLSGTLKTVRVNDVMVERDRIAIQLYSEGETAILFH